MYDNKDIELNGPKAILFGIAEKMCLVSIICVVSYMVVTAGIGCSSQAPSVAPPVDDFNFTLPFEEEDFNITPPFVVTEEMMVETINRDTFLLNKINNLEDELSIRTNLLSNVMLMFKNELDKIKSCECETTEKGCPMGDNLENDSPYNIKMDHPFRRPGLERKP